MQKFPPGVGGHFLSGPGSCTVTRTGHILVGTLYNDLLVKEH